MLQGSLGAILGAASAPVPVQMSQTRTSQTRSSQTRTPNLDVADTDGPKPNGPKPNVPNPCFLNLSNPKPRHTTGGSGRGGAQRGGGAVRGRVAQEADGTVRPEDKRPSCPPGLPRNYIERHFGCKNIGNPM